MLKLELTEVTTGEGGVVVGQSGGPGVRAGRRVEQVDVEPSSVVHVEYGARRDDGLYAVQGRLVLRASDMALLARRRNPTIREDQLAVPQVPRRDAISALVKVVPAEKLVGAAVKLAATNYEEHTIGATSRLVASQEPHRVTRDDADFEPSGAGPVLVLVHGTFATTGGSFGALSGAGSGAGGWGRVREAYRDRIFALQHRTLSESPVANALTLARALRGVSGPVDLLTHSRGGIVSELLCVARDLEESQLSAWSGRNWGRGPSEEEQDGLRQLRRLATNLQIRRVTRVATPLFGTTLLSERLDAFVNVLLNLSGLATGAGGSIPFELFSKLVESIVGTRLDEGVLPGLECMVPGRPISELFAMKPEGTGELVAIAGNNRRPGFWGLLRNLVPELFFGGKNDLVVDTASMLGGARGAETDARKVVLQRQSLSDDSLWHTTYFENRRVCGDLDLTLCGVPLPEIEGRQEIRSLGAQRSALGAVLDVAVGGGIEDVGFARDLSPPSPLIFVVPGIMGSELREGSDRIWVDLGSLAAGRFDRLDPDQRRAIAASSVLRAKYDRLVTWLSQRANVRVFPYDWRLSIAKSATLLADELRREVSEPGRVVHLVAHSMGGLVCRMILAQEPDLWRSFKEKGGRLVMLGTPNRGAPGIVQLLLGEDALFRKLAGLDLKNKPLDLLQVIHRFDGVLQMLPHDTADRDYTKPSTWDDVKGARARLTVPVDASGLRRARKVMSQLASAVDPENMSYIAGRSEQPTPAAVVEADAGTWTVVGDTRGDGTVPWAAGRLSTRSPTGEESEVPMWVMPATHGDLADFPPAFPAILNLLERGKTDMLPRLDGSLSAARGDAAPPSAVLVPLGESVLPGPATEEELLGGWLGGGADRSGWTLQLEVRVGDVVLGAPELPVLVPVTRSGRLSGPAQDLDDALDRAISSGLRTGTLTGALGEIELLERPPPREGAPVRRAVVVGLGNATDLTHAALVEPLTRALLRAAQRWPEAGTARGLRVASLGTSLRAIDWMNAAIEAAIRAHRVLETEGIDGGFDRLVFIDLQQSQALQFLQYGAEVATRPPLALWANESIAAPTGLVREELPATLMPGIVPAAVLSSLVPPPPRPTVHWTVRSSALGSDLVRFDIAWTTGRAAAGLEQRDVLGRRVEHLIESLTSGVSLDGGRETFLEGYLLPRELSRSLTQGNDVLLSVDERAARVPWEILLAADLPGGREPGVRLDMLRNFLDTGFDGLGEPIPSARALLIEPPRNLQGFAPLPGAEHEIADARAQLEKRYAVTTRPGNEREGLFSALGGTWEVLHLSGHGVYDAESEAKTGFVLGDGDVLSALDLRSMYGRFPYLVFINSCYGASSGKFHRPGHAAGLARACIRGGARAVVAAGWAIADDAAAAFAHVFYQKMLAGCAFGEAVASARAMAAATSAGSTWAAYQCYGDPNFVLPSVTPLAARRRWRSTSVDELGPPPQVVQEVIDASVEVRMLLTRAERGLGGESTDLLARSFELWTDRISPQLLDDSGAALALGRTWLQLRNREKALAAFKRGSKDEMRPVGLSAVIEEIEKQLKTLQSASHGELRTSTVEGKTVKRAVPSTGTSLVMRDPNKEHFGRLARRDGFQLSAQVEDLDPDRPVMHQGDGKLALVHLRVEGTKGSRAAIRSAKRRARARGSDGTVEFSLHPTFTPREVPVSLRQGVAELTVHAYGAFTVGATVSIPGRPPVKLELDLANYGPEWFRER